MSRIREILERKKREKAAAAAAEGQAATGQTPAALSPAAHSSARGGGDGGPVDSPADAAPPKADAPADAAPPKKVSNRKALLAQLAEKNRLKLLAQSAKVEDDGLGESPVETSTKDDTSSAPTVPSSATAPGNRAAMMERLKQKKAQQQQEAAQIDSGLATTSKEETPVTKSTEDTESKSEATSAGMTDLSVDLEALKLETVPEKKRGIKGKTVNASANIIRMAIKEDKGVFEYNVKFSPIIDDIKEKKFIVRQLSNLIGGTKVFDGATLSLPILLDRPQYEVSADMSSGEKVIVTLKIVKRRQLKDCEQLFNVLFRRVMEHLKMVEIKRNHYDPSAKMMVPAHKLEIWPGYVVRCQEMDGGLMLTCDTSSKVLRKETAYSLMKDVQRKGGNNFKANLEKALIGSVVMTEYNKAMTYRIDDIDLEMSPMSKFTLYSGEEITYQDYYKRTYDIDIKDLHQPMLIYRQKKRQELGVEKTLVLVPELCRMTGLTDNMISDFRVMKDVAVFTRIGPDQRQKCLKKFIDNVHKSAESVQLLDEWGLVLEKEPIKLKARVLEAEKLVMGKGAKISVNLKADWGNESTRNTSLVAVPLKSWHVVCADRNKAVVQGFIKLFKTLAPKMGITVAEPSLTVLANDKTELFLNDMKKVIRPDLQLIVCIVPLQREDRYGAIKKFCNSDSPIPSQVVCAKTISNEKKVNSCVQKIILQVNCKLGGELWGAIIPVKTLMVIGIDVFHDPTRALNSVVGCVGSMNATMSAWSNACKFQRSGQELIDVLKMCIGTLVNQYKKHNECYPSQVIVYRDGVGDGQLDHVSIHEAGQLESLFKSFGFEPEFAFIVVQKRINRRFFNMEGDKYINPPPGSVLDHTVMKKHMYDFLLVSQHVTQGTVTPSHYIVIRDSTNFSWDVIQKISYKLTHMYFNWPGTVRVPAPCQYAHKLAYQVGEHTKVEPSPELMNRLFFL